MHDLIEVLSFLRPETKKVSIRKKANDTNSMEEFMNKQVIVSTREGRSLTGQLKGFDKKSTNIILQSCSEIVYSQMTGEVSHVPLGLYVIRGNHVCFVAELREES